MKRNLGAPSWSAFVIITFATLAAPDRLPGEQPGVPAQREAISDDVAGPYERLDPDTAWCGPLPVFLRPASRARLHAARRCRVLSHRPGPG